MTRATPFPSSAAAGSRRQRHGLPGRAASLPDLAGRALAMAFVPAVFLGGAAHAALPPPRAATVELIEAVLAERGIDSLHDLCGAIDIRSGKIIAAWPPNADGKCWEEKKGK